MLRPFLRTAVRFGGLLSLCLIASKRSDEESGAGGAEVVERRHGDASAAAGYDAVAIAPPDRLPHGRRNVYAGVDDAPVDTTRDLMKAVCDCDAHPVPRSTAAPPQVLNPLRARGSRFCERLA